MKYDKETMEVVRSRLGYIYECYNGWDRFMVLRGLKAVVEQLDEMEAEDVYE